MFNTVPTIQNKGKQKMIDTGIDDMFSGMIGRIAPGCCRLSYNGKIAVKTSNGKYKTYNLKTGNLTNCERFVLDIADDFFMVMPTRKLRVGDIIVFNGKPKCIIAVQEKTVSAVNYDTSVVETIIPERHVFMGKQFYGKVVSLMSAGFGGKGNSFVKNMMKMKLMGAMMGGKSVGNLFGGEGSNMLPMMLLMGNGSMDGMFGDMFNDDDESGALSLFGDDDEDDDEEEAELEPAPKKLKKAKKATK